MLGPRSRLSLGTALMERTGREDRQMPGPGELPAPQPAPVIGRDAGLARLRALVDPVPQASQVLPVTGRESESRLAFAGLHQLLRPVLPAAAGLPARQGRALSGALGLSADPGAPHPGAPDPLLTGVAVLTLLSDLSEHSPVLVVAANVQSKTHHVWEDLALPERLM